MELRRTHQSENQESKDGSAHLFTQDIDLPLVGFSMGSAQEGLEPGEMPVLERRGGGEEQPERWIS